MYLTRWFNSDLAVSACSEWICIADKDDLWPDMNTYLRRRLVNGQCVHALSAHVPDRMIVDHSYIALFSALEQTHCTCMWFYMSAQLFIVCFWIFTKALAWLVPLETTAILAHFVYIIQPCTTSFHAKPHTYSACIFSCNLMTWQC